MVLKSALINVKCTFTKEEHPMVQLLTQKQERSVIAKLMKLEGPPTHIGKHAYLLQVLFRSL